MEDEHLLCGDPWREKHKENKGEDGMMKQVNQWKLGGEEEEKWSETLDFKKAARQNSWIIDAYNSRQKLKIEDKCTDINDVIHHIRHLDLGISCMLTVASSPLRAKTRPLSKPVSKPCETVTCTQHPAGHVHIGALVFKAEAGSHVLYSCRVPELTARSRRNEGLLELRTPTWSVAHILLHLHFSH